MVAEASHFASSENRQTGTVRICLARSYGANDSHRVRSRKAKAISLTVTAKIVGTIVCDDLLLGHRRAWLSES
jgi:hypothetical protein